MKLSFCIGQKLIKFQTDIKAGLGLLGTYGETFTDCDKQMLI